MAIPHVRGAIVDAKTGAPTRLFYELLSRLEPALNVVEDAETSLFLELLGVGSDASADSESSASESDFLHFLPANDSEFGEFEKRHGFAIKELAAGETAITTDGNQLLICNNTAAGTVTLDTTPFDGEQLIIKRRGATLSLVGTIDGRTDWTMPTAYEALRLIYTAAGGEWSVL